MNVFFGKIKNDLKRYIVLGKELNTDPRVPKISKVLMGLAIGYFFLPIDLIPDFIPIIGHLDDIIIIPSLIFLAIILIPKAVYREHYERIFHPQG